MRFLNSLAFLTIIKIPEKFYVKQQDYPNILVYFPVVGLLIGLVSSILFFFLNFIFPIILTVIIMVGSEILLTGSIHIDGLSDTFDGVFSGEKDKKKILAIMKKGDVGVFGVLAIIFSILLKVCFHYFIATGLGLSRLLDPGGPGTGRIIAGTLNPVIDMQGFLPGFFVFLTVIVFTPVYGRLLMLYLFSRYEPVSQMKSLTGAFRDKSNRDVFIFSTIYFSIAFITASVLARTGFYNAAFDIYPGMSPLIYAIEGIIIIVLTMLVAAGAGRFFTRRTGGLNGDIIGAVCVLGEVTFLFLNYISIIFL